MQSRGPSRAVVVHIVDGNLGHAKLIEDSLTASAVTIAVASDSLIDIVVIDLRIEEGFDTGLETELGVVDLATRFDELGQAYSKHVGWCGCLFAHVEKSRRKTSVLK